MRHIFSITLFLTLFLVSCAEKPRFELLDAKKTGIDFVNAVEESDSLHILNFEYIYNGAGVGIVDLAVLAEPDLRFGDRRALGVHRQPLKGDGGSGNGESVWAAKKGKHSKDDAHVCGSL